MERLQKQSAFTLIELVAVIVILAIVTIGVTGFIRSGAQIFVDVTERDQLLSDSRFVVERLNREIRNAMPNSLRLAGNNSRQCLEFLPIRWSTYYFDIPVQPEAADDEIEVVEWDVSDPYVYQTRDEVMVYPTVTEHAYNSSFDRFHSLAGQPGAAVNNVITLNLTRNERFAADSPSSRLYIVGAPVSYCVFNGTIVRYEGYRKRTSQSTVLGASSASLMGENVANTLSGSPGNGDDDPFRISQATLTRNASVIVLLRFELGEEIVVFSNETHLPNVP